MNTDDVKIGVCLSDCLKRPFRRSANSLTRAFAQLRGGPSTSEVNRTLVCTCCYLRRCGPGFDASPLVTDLVNVVVVNEPPAQKLLR